jgi:hypothetical protein
MLERSSYFNTQISCKFRLISYLSQNFTSAASHWLWTDIFRVCTEIYACAQFQNYVFSCSDVIPKSDFTRPQFKVWCDVTYSGRNGARGVTWQQTVAFHTHRHDWVVTPMTFSSSKVSGKSMFALKYQIQVHQTAQNLTFFANFKRTPCVEVSVSVTWNQNLNHSTFFLNQCMATVKFFGRFRLSDTLT